MPSLPHWSRPPSIARSRGLGPSPGGRPTAPTSAGWRSRAASWTSSWRRADGSGPPLQVTAAVPVTRLGSYGGGGWCWAGTGRESSTRGSTAACSRPAPRAARLASSRREGTARRAACARAGSPSCSRPTTPVPSRSCRLDGAAPVIDGIRHRPIRHRPVRRVTRVGRGLRVGPGVVARRRMDRAGTSGTCPRCRGTTRGSWSRGRRRRTAVGRVVAGGDRARTPSRSRASRPTARCSPG